MNDDEGSGSPTAGTQVVYRLLRCLSPRPTRICKLTARHVGRYIVHTIQGKRTSHIAEKKKTKKTSMMDGAG